jgi:hypothetical protein
MDDAEPYIVSSHRGNVDKPCLTFGPMRQLSWGLAMGEGLSERSYSRHLSSWSGLVVSRLLIHAQTDISQPSQAMLDCASCPHTGAMWISHVLRLDRCSSPARECLGPNVAVHWLSIMCRSSCSSTGSNCHPCNPLRAIPEPCTVSAHRGNVDKPCLTIGSVQQPGSRVTTLAGVGRLSVVDA